jgi:ppGpp synthetase/RelA/SpoT-type nucleotidyltranferase
MTQPAPSRAPEPEEVERVLEQFEAKRDKLEAFCAKAKSLIEEALQDAGIRYQSVQARVKSKRKLREKYLDPSKGYTKLDDITDLAGLRIITYYEDEVDQVAEVIKREFEVDPERSVDKRRTEPDRFGYQAANYVCCHARRRLADVEYKKYAGVWCEIQITSILRHAWSEMEHEWYDLRDAYPDEIRRRFSRVMGVFELVEAEFIDLKKKRSDYQRSVDVRIQAEVPDLSVDAVSLRSLIVQDGHVAELDRAVSTRIRARLVEVVNDGYMERLSKAARIAGLSTVNQVRGFLKKYSEALPEYAALWLASSLKGRQRKTTRVAMRGISVFYMTTLLIAARGEDQLRDALERTYGILPGPEEITARAAAAATLLSKYAPPTDVRL